MMANIPFSFQVGVFVDVPLCNGMNQIGRILSITQNTLSVCWWAIEHTQGSSESFYSWLLLVSRIYRKPGTGYPGNREQGIQETWNRVSR